MRSSGTTRQLPMGGSRWRFAKSSTSAAVGWRRRSDGEIVGDRLPHRRRHGQRAARRRGRGRAGGRGRARSVPRVVGQLRPASGPRRCAPSPTAWKRTHRRLAEHDEPRGRDADRHVAAGAGRPAAGRVPLDGRHPGGLSRSRPASALRCSSGSRPASSPRSRRGITRCTSSRRSWPPRSRPAAPRSSSRPAPHRSPPSCWPRSSTSWACRRAR